MAVERQTPRDQAVSIRLRPVAINTPEGKINGTALRLGGAFPPTTIFDFPTLNVIHVRRKAENSGLAMVLHGTTNGFRKGLEASQNTAAVKLSEKDGKRSFIRISDRGVAVENIHSSSEQRQSIAPDREHVISPIMLRQHREQRGESVRGLAKALGVSPSLVSSIELGKISPTTPKFIKAYEKLYGFPQLL